MNKKLTINYKFLMKVVTFILVTIVSANNLANNNRLEWTAVSQKQQFTIQVKPKKNSKIPLREFHQWLVNIKDLDGAPVENISISVSGGMQAHKHGLPSQPTVTEYLGGGNYLVEGVLFNMAGKWTLVFNLEKKGMIDQAELDFVLSF